MLFLKLFISFLLVFASFAFAAPTSSSDEKNYLIYLKNTSGEYKVYQNSNTQKRDASQVFVESTVNKINDLIVKNKKSFKNQSKLAEIQSKPQNVDTYSESKLVYPISSVDDSVILLAYLSEELVSEVLNMPNVVTCVQDEAIFEPTSNYNTEDILNETGWKNLKVHENADYHLSLISQGKHTNNSTKVYDTNYYYPASAGKGADIIIIDTSFNFKHKEFKNINDRTVRCAGNVVDGRVSRENIDNFCGESYNQHGEKVSDVAAGLVHGVAKLANIHGISIPSFEGFMSTSDIIGALQYVYEKMRPNRTVINLSLRALVDSTEDYYYQQYDMISKKIVEKGGCIVASAGNDGLNLYKSSEIVIPCEINSVICVGGIDNSHKDFDKVYSVSAGSNYGRNVDVYAPYYVYAEFSINGEKRYVYSSGTSFSSPIVAGLISTIMSEFSGTKYTKERMLYLLQKHGIQFLLNTGNRHNIGIMVNNGKLSLYGDQKCGDGFGSCPQGQCCSSKGSCGTTEDYCSISKGCQISLGDCH